MTKKWQEQTTPNTTLGEQLVFMQAEIDELRAELARVTNELHAISQDDGKLEGALDRALAELAALKQQEPVAIVHPRKPHQGSAQVEFYRVDVDMPAKLYLAAGAQPVPSTERTCDNCCNWHFKGYDLEPCSSCTKGNHMHDNFEPKDKL